MNAAEARLRFASAPVARLATLGPDGAPHLVPITFALLGADTIVSAIDHKPKRTPALARLRNIESDPRVCVLADHYTDDWSALWWARADGTAAVHTPELEGKLCEAAITALTERYPAYRERRPAGSVVVVTVARWSGWSAS
jgi:PPOX class probable F420-dependent enzyme